MCSEWLNAVINDLAEIKSAVVSKNFFQGFLLALNDTVHLSSMDRISG